MSEVTHDTWHNFFKSPINKLDKYVYFCTTFLYLKLLSNKAMLLPGWIHRHKNSTVSSHTGLLLR